MPHYLSNSRKKWLFAITVVAIGAGIATKNVISYPTECLPSAATETKA